MQLSEDGRGSGIALEVVRLGVPRVSLLIPGNSGKLYK